MTSGDQLTIETPEQIALELPIAGIGSRFLALTIATLLQAILYVVAFFALVSGVFVAGAAGICLPGLSGSGHSYATVL